MNRETALEIGRRVQMHPYDGKSLAERIADELLKAYEAGARETADEVIRRMPEAILKAVAT